MYQLSFCFAHSLSLAANELTFSQVTFSQKFSFSFGPRSCQQRALLSSSGVFIGINTSFGQSLVEQPTSHCPEANQLSYCAVLFCPLPANELTFGQTSSSLGANVIGADNDLASTHKLWTRSDGTSNLPLLAVMFGSE